MLNKFNETDRKKWTPVYAKYNNFYSIFLIVVIVIAFTMTKWDLALPISIESLLLLIWLGYFPSLLWDIKTGYLSSPIFVPAGLFSHKIKSVSRQYSPLIFWAVIWGQTILFSTLGGIIVYSLIKKV